MAKPLVLPLASQQPGPAWTVTFQIIFPEQDIAVQCPGFRVQPGAIVTLRPLSPSGVNTQPLNIGETPEACFPSTGSPSVVIAPGADVTVPWVVNNLAEIWAAGSPGDGLLITVQQPQIG